MKLTASIIYPYDERILSLFSAENKAFSRAQYTVHHTGNNLIFHVEADDSTSLRACLTTITKVLSVWETTLLHGAH